MIKPALIQTIFTTTIAAALAGPAGAASSAELDKIKNIVVIYAQNRSFDNLYGSFPGVKGLQDVGPGQGKQLDRDGKPLPELPPVWGGLSTGPTVTEEDTAKVHLPNQPFKMTDPTPFNLTTDVMTRTLSTRFYQGQMQIDGGKNDKFVAWGDSGALVMAYYDGIKLPMWPIAKEYVLADNFFMAAFGGGFLNRMMSICACAPVYPHADQSPAKDLIAAVDKNGVSLTVAPDSPASAMKGPPKFVNDGALTPDFYAVNTMQPPYQPSGNKPADGGDKALADPKAPTTLPPQTETTIGDLLSKQGVSWAWYAGGWDAALRGYADHPKVRFQFQYQPFNYFASLAPGTPERAKSLKDAGFNAKLLLEVIDHGELPQVTFYQPEGFYDGHVGKNGLVSGDQHVENIIEHLEHSPQWQGTVALVIFDDNGGFWDHAAPPKGDRWGPGNRVPAMIISPFAKKGTVDHALYDTTSALRLITARYGLPVLPGLSARDAAMKANGEQPIGDFTAALSLGQ